MNLVFPWVAFVSCFRGEKFQVDPFHSLGSFRFSSAGFWNIQYGFSLRFLFLPFFCFLENFLLSSSFTERFLLVILFFSYEKRASRAIIFSSSANEYYKISLVFRIFCLFEDFSSRNLLVMAFPSSHSLFFHHILDKVLVQACCTWLENFVIRSWVVFHHEVKVFIRVWTWALNLTISLTDWLRWVSKPLSWFRIISEVAL